jgi:hypothetical protein
MLISENKLRQIIREEILSEVPLDFVGDYKIPADETGDAKSTRPSIGRAGLKLKSYTLKAKGMFQDTQHSWAIITLSDTYRAPKTIKSPEFKRWLAAQGISPNTRILVVTGSHLPKDFKGVNWAIGHDIFGHSLSKFTTRTLPKFQKQEFNQYGETVDPQYDISSIIEGAVWQVIPEEMRLGGEGDRLPDVLMAIFRGRLSRDTAVQAAIDGIEEEIPEEERRPGDPEAWAATTVDHYFKSVKDWIESIRPGVPVMINPFSGNIDLQDEPVEKPIPSYDSDVPF